MAPLCALYGMTAAFRGIIGAGIPDTRLPATLPPVLAIVPRRRNCGARFPWSRALSRIRVTQRIQAECNVPDRWCVRR